MIKRSLTGMIASNAFSSTKEAQAAHAAKDYDLEVQNCVVAQLLLGLTVEGAANEVGDGLFTEWASDRFESADTAFKWWFISAHANRTPFHQGAEPLQTVTDLIKIRNKIAHPKVHDFEGLHLQNISGDIEKNVLPNRLLQTGDRMLTPTVQYMEDHGYNYTKTLSLLKRTLAAVITLRDHVGIKGFFWADQIRPLAEHMR